MERNIFTMVKREAAKIKDAMTAEKLFQRPEIKRQFSSMVDALTQVYGESKIHVDLMHDEENQMTAGTTGDYIILNTGNELINFFTRLFERYMVFLPSKMSSWFNKQTSFKNLAKRPLAMF